jgi:membrane protease YdiL (CAAX protease family)
MHRLKARLIGWSAFVCFFALLAYASHFSGEKPPEDVAYRWDSSILGLIQYAIVFGVIWLLTLGLDRRQFLAVRRPASWWRATGIAALVLIAVFAAGAAVAAFGGDAEKEQGLIPESFDSDKIAQFAAFTAIVTVVAPIVEELMFRGVGYGLLERFGRTTAVVIVGLAFAVTHGLVAGFPVIATFGIGLAYLRSRTDSIYPCILLHASFNAAGLAIGVAG